MKRILHLLLFSFFVTLSYGQHSQALQSEESYYRFRQSGTQYDVLKYGLDSTALKVKFSADTLSGHTVDTIIVRLKSKNFYLDDYTVDDSVIWKGTADTSYTFTKGYGVEKYYKLDSDGDSATRYKINTTEWLFNRK
jgi:hypothetical protein